MSESNKNESESSATPNTVPVGPGSNQSSAPSSVVDMQSPMGPTQIPAQFVFQQQIMASPQQQLMASPQQQQGGNTPGPSPGGQQTQPGGGANPSPMNGGGMNAAMTMNPSAMSTINMSAMNSMMPSLANHGMAGMTMTSMNAAGFQQSMGHPVMSSGAMPQVQVIQQQQLPYLYSNAQGQQFIMPGNIALQPSGVNQTIQSAGFGQPIQVIAAGKPFQQGQLTPHLQIAGKNMLQGHQNDNNTALLQFINNARNNGCIPTSNNQTLVIGPLISNTQAGGYNQQGQQQQGKQNDINKQVQQQQQQQQQPFFQFVNGMPPKSPVMTSAKGNMPGTGVSVSQAPNMIPQPQIVTSQANSAPMQLGNPMQPMQIIGQMQGSQMGQPFGLLPPTFWTTSGGIAGQQGPIFIRGPQPDGGMFFQAAPQPTITAQAAPQTGVATAIKPRAETPKTGGTRPLSAILPSSSGSSTTPTPIRPASSISTQTASGGSATNVQAGAPRPAGKTKKVGRPPQNQPRPVAPTVVQAQPTLLQPVQQQQQQLQLQQQQQNQQLHVSQQLIAQQFQMQHPFQIQQYQQQQQQQQPTLMSLPAFQQVTQQSLDANQQAQLQQAINDQQQAQQQAQQQHQLQLQYQMNKPVMTVASSTATSCAATSVSVTTSSAPQHMMSPAPMQSVTPTIQQVPQQSQQQPMPPSSSSASFVTTTSTVRSSYKPIAPAPPQPPNLIAMNDKTDQHILTIPVGSAVYPIGAHGIRPATPINNFQTMNGDMGQQGQLNIHMSSQPTTCFITSPAVTTASRMSAPLGGGLITVGPAAPLSAMANMTQAVPQSSSTPITICTSGPRMALPSLQPVTVTVSGSSPLPSPARPPTVEEPKQSPRTEPTTTAESPSNKKESSQMNGMNGDHSPAVREKKEPNLPQAVVRPQILTHVLGDFVIQESSEPFPVGRFHPSESLTRCNGHRNNENNFKLDGEPPKKKLHVEQPTVQSPPLPPTTNDLQQMSTPKGATMATCEGCGKMDFISKFRRSKRFCSTACSKKPTMNSSPAVETVQPIQQQPAVSTTNGQGTKTAGLLTTATTTVAITIDANKLPPPTTIPQSTPSGFAPSGDKEDSSIDAELLALAAQQMRSPTASLSQTPTQQLKQNPAKWSVTEVADFVRNLAGCADYAEDFAMQEIDGQALMLLKADHLMSAMSMKLGPALKICAKIDAMRGASAAEGGCNNNQPNGN